MSEVSLLLEREFQDGTELTNAVMKAIGSQHRTCRIVKSTGVYYRYKCSFSDCDWIVNASKRKLKKGKKSALYREYRHRRRHRQVIEMKNCDC
jgi:hypothetical protein